MLESWIPLHVHVDHGGPGYIAGTSPYGLVTVNAVPAARWVEVRHRATRRVIATQFSAHDGTYRFDGLDPAQEFDVIFRDWSQQYNDVIYARVRPCSYDVTAVTGSFSVNDGTHALDGYLAVTGGEPGHVVTVASGTAPTGIEFAVAAIQPEGEAVTWAVQATGTASAGTYAWTLRVPAPNGSHADIACEATFA
jgi:hypothetical protein